MSANKLQILGGAILGLSIVGGLYYFLSKQSVKTTVPDPANPTKAITTASDDFPLKVGSRGANVSALQTKLNLKITKLPVPQKALVVDGIFGEKTLEGARGVLNNPALTQVTKEQFDTKI
jgi:peptidoglycan hydrolase-like protein with peptidoglycan-binding domain